MQRRADRVAEAGETFIPSGGRKIQTCSKSSSNIILLSILIILCWITKKLLPENLASELLTSMEKQMSSSSTLLALLSYLPSKPSTSSISCYAHVTSNSHSRSPPRTFINLLPWSTRGFASIHGVLLVTLPCLVTSRHVRKTLFRKRFHRTFLSFINFPPT